MNNFVFFFSVSFKKFFFDGGGGSCCYNTAGWQVKPYNLMSTYAFAYEYCMLASLHTFAAVGR
jgi:hypothetical protein